MVRKIDWALGGLVVSEHVSPRESHSWAGWAGWNASQSQLPPSHVTVRFFNLHTLLTRHQASC